MLSILAKVIWALSYITRTKHAGHRFLASAVSVVQGYDMGILLINLTKGGRFPSDFSFIFFELTCRGNSAKSLLHMKEAHAEQTQTRE